MMINKKYSILLIEDEQSRMYDSIEVLKIEHNVAVCKYVEELEDIIKHNSFSLIILDIMILQKPIPLDDKYSFDESYDMASGGYFALDIIAKTIKKENIPPILILTNVPLDEIIEERIKDFPIIGKLNKLATLPSELLSFINTNMK
jgi:CheY-like chemotaxis protein